MSNLDDREQLIQQRQAEKYVNVIRMTLLSFMTAALLLRYSGIPHGSPFEGSLPPLLLVAAWIYASVVHWSISRGFMPRYLPWVTTLTDYAFIAIGLGAELTVELSVGPSLAGGPFLAATSLSWGYALLFLLILFSTLRERPELTLFNGLASMVVYGVCLASFFRNEGTPGFWTDQGFRLVFLLLAGLFSTFHARSVRKAFQRAATSDRLRRETDARLKVLSHHFPGVLFQAEVVGQVFSLRYVSEGCRDLLGLDPKALTNQPDVFFEKSSPGLKEALWKHLEPADSVRNWEEEFPYQAPGDRSLWLNLSATTVQTPQGTLVVNGLITDVSEKRRTAEALREANQAKTDFLATMSHELRTPLNAILGNADHLARLADQEDDKKAFRDLQASGETLLGLIEDILVFSRLEAGRLVAEIRPVAWKPQLESLFDTFRPQASAKRLAFHVHYPADAPAVVWTDFLRLRQIVGNLLVNAIKFTPSGAIDVEVSFELGERVSWLFILVADTGIGIPTEAQERVFEKFTQGEHGKSRTYGGLGLGLSIGRSLAELLGGTLTVKSQPGEGSVFTLGIPVQTGNEQAAGAALGTNLEAPKRLIKVLLVEDNLTNQDVATRMLKKLGAHVDLAPGGREAVTRASETFYDLIFMDWQMPIMDGREATAKIRGLPGGQDLVIVALSGHALPGDRELLLASGFDDYLSKPVRMDDFRTMLAKWVKRVPDQG